MKHKLDQLVTSATFDCGKLCEAAEKKKDQSIDLHILEKDCIALEVKCYQKCYKQYTSFLRYSSPPNETPYTPYTFSKSFESFCSWMKREVIENQNIFYMTRLRVFFKTVVEMENENASHYKTLRLKRRLQERFHELVFHKPKKRYNSEIIITKIWKKILSQKKQLKQMRQVQKIHTMRKKQRKEMTKTWLKNRRMALRDLYLVALKLRENIKRNSVSWYRQWPPLASEKRVTASRNWSPCFFSILLRGYLAILMSLMKEDTLIR